MFGVFFYFSPYIILMNIKKDNKYNLNLINLHSIATNSVANSAKDIHANCQ